MLSFIITDNSKISKYKEIIDKVLINYDYNYEVKQLTNDIINTDSFKIYIIDNKELSLARKIRFEIDDWQSIIIYIGNNIEEVIKERLFILDFIREDDNLLTLLERSILVALKNYDKRPNKLKYTYKKTIYNIEYYKILYIEKEKDNKRCIIKTNDNNYYYQSSLSSLENKLDNRFIKINKSIIVNIEQVDYYDIKDNLIVLKNKEKIYSISKNQKNKLIEKLRWI